ncbi:MAG: hypothetical protein HC939_12135 [Pleurocapsa sp. SU_5_0]|nr:hypothetical protein [Pleurocapsa sp. SU_5_0]NJO97402.1 hypothetical protein [Pleurocapsa sp. CRU_1_2]NJR48030.1 hypothetical protein [Hyellaceae cyanobacterium CSU_1_1]
MTLEQQLQIIIDDATNYGVPSAVVEQAIAPILKSFAQQLQHLEYYVLQNLDEDWVLTTITNPQLQQSKTVIYAFVSVQDAATFQGTANPNLIAMPISVVQLLFRLFSLEQVDSIIFLENSPNLNHGVEIKRDRLSQLVQQQIQQLVKIPPNLA